uniref:Uncharacterized protein n=1 Tax=Meloidogyne incognita TaxID=6306 RepID=A0A914KPV8_MELIC
MYSNACVNKRINVNKQQRETLFNYNLQSGFSRWILRRTSGTCTDSYLQDARKRA